MTFKDWTNYFESRTNHFDHIEWTNKMELDGHEEKLLTASLQQFQKGENSDGKHLMKLTEKMNDEDYTNAMKGLIKEEQNHAAVLGKFMCQEKIATIEDHWLDTIFKRIIKTPNLELTIMILLAAEIVATVFYQALQKASYSKTLHAICKQILVDEEMHLKFQATALRKLYQNHSLFGKFVVRNFYQGFIIVVALVAWFQYRNVFKAGGFTFKKCLYELMHEFAKVTRMVIGKKEIINHKDLPSFEHLAGLTKKS